MKKIVLVMLILACLLSGCKGKNIFTTDGMMEEVENFINAWRTMWFIFTHLFEVITGQVKIPTY